MDPFAQFAAFESFASNLVDGDTNGVEDVFVRGLLANPHQITQRVSVSSTGAQANASSGTPAISANARYVAFVSNATNLVGTDTNGVRDIFVHDLVTGKTKRVGVGIHGQANGPSQLPAITGDGRCIAFASSASNLVPGDTNNATDIFVRDTVAKTTTRVSVASDGTQANGSSSAPSMSSCDDVVYQSLASDLVSGDTNGESDVFERTPGFGTTRLSVTTTGDQPNGPSGEPVISGNDRYVAYTSSASNLVPGDTNLDPDVFRVDTLTGQTERWSLATNGSQAAFGLSTGQPSITTTGASIAFACDASNLAPGDGLLSQGIFLRHP
jgi:dipeptidyl aminopeptidase/acylaminoacyl peptidase